MDLVTAAEIARAHGIDPKRYRQALRDAKLSWYIWGAPWTVPKGSPQHDDMLRVMQTILGGRSATSIKPLGREPSSSTRQHSDEAYVIDLCDAFLCQSALRQHKFDFLRGDEGLRGQGRMLPVDAWYPDLGLVVEYRERQHSEAIRFFDRRSTVSGVGRGEQRRLYDQRRRDVLPLNGISLVEFDFFEFQHTSNRRLVRCAADKDIVVGKLKRFVT